MSTFKTMKINAVLTILFILSLIWGQNVNAQEVFFEITGRGFFPDSAVLKANNITKIYKKQRDYLIMRKDTSEFAPIHDDYFFINGQGLIDSTTTWSSNNDDSLFCISKGFEMFNNKGSWIQYHRYGYYCTFMSGAKEKVWLPCQQDVHSYKVIDNNVISPGFDTSIIAGIVSDSTKTSGFINAFRFHENNRLIKDSLVIIDELGAESKKVRLYFYNENNNVFKVIEKITNQDGVFDTSEIRYEFDSSNNLIRKVRYHGNDETGEVQREFAYDKKGKLIYEEVAFREFGVKSRKYYYDSMGRMSKIKEKHFRSGNYRYFIEYDERGFLTRIIDQDRRGQFKTISTFSYETSGAM